MSSAVEGKYTLISAIGEGVFGTVDLGRRVSDGKLVAIKRVFARPLPRRGMMSDEDYDALCRQVSDIGSEARILGQLSHPNIIQIYDSYMEGQKLTLYLEYMPSSLPELIPITQSSCLSNYVKQLLSAVAYLHQNQVMHRDIKPANVLIDPQEQVLKLADFGLACFIEPNGHYSHHVCSRWYRAPELLFGSRKYDQAIDLWSLGCLLYEMATGTVLFQGDSDILQIVEVFRKLGSPDPVEWPGLAMLPDYGKIEFKQFDTLSWDVVLDGTEEWLKSIIGAVLIYNPDKRASARNLLENENFTFVTVTTVT